MKKLSKKSLILSALVTAVLVIFIGGWIFTRTQFFKDQVTAMKYPLDRKIKSVADDGGLSKKGVFLLQVSRAEFNDRKAFSSLPKPDSVGEDFHIDGLYFKKRIYIYNVTNEKLDGVNTVVTAHEMLHAGYDRLSVGQKAVIDKKIKDYIPNIKNKEIKKQVNLYKAMEPGQEYDELHSMLATEEEKLPKDLEDYYKKYFDNRQLVIKKYQKVSKVISDLQDKITDLQSKMKKLKAEIETEKANYSSENEKLKSDIASFNEQAGSGHMNEGDYNTQRASLEERMNSLQAESDQVNNKVNSYNKMGEDLKKLGVEAQTIDHSLDSNVPAVSGKVA